MKAKLAISALLTISVVFALSYFVHAQGGVGVRVVASCGAAGYPLGAVREWTMSTAGIIC
jgi:hypothetical protein